MFENPESETLVYKEEIQDRFNWWYDHYLNIIDKLKEE
jgi:hypothetical protein